MPRTWAPSLLGPEAPGLWIRSLGVFRVTNQDCCAQRLFTHFKESMREHREARGRWSNVSTKPRKASSGVRLLSSGLAPEEDPRREFGVRALEAQELTDAGGQGGL